MDNKVLFGNYWVKFRFADVGSRFIKDGAPYIKTVLVYNKEGKPFNAVHERRGEFDFFKDDDDIYIPSFLFEN